MKNKIISIISTSIISVSCLVSTSLSAKALPRDPNGDGIISIADYVTIAEYLIGNDLPTNLTPYDFDQNGIISEMDAEKVLIYDAGDHSIVPNAGANDPVVSPNASALGYFKHDCASTDNQSYSYYALYPSMMFNSVKDEQETDIIIGNNDMVKDNDTSVVKIAYNDGGWGSGFILDDRIIATAAHCVYNCNTDEFLNFTVQVIGTTNTVVKTVTPKYIHIPSLFATNNSNNDYAYDYALIYLNEDIGVSNYGAKQLGIALNTYIDNEYNNQVTVSGFPASIPSGYSGIAGMMRFYANGFLHTTYATNPSDTNLLLYSADMLPGDSGGPVYVNEATTAFGSNYSFKPVIGINTCETTTYNQGVRVNTAMLIFYYNNIHVN